MFFFSKIRKITKVFVVVIVVVVVVVVVPSSLLLSCIAILFWVDSAELSIRHNL